MSKTPDSPKRANTPAAMRPWDFTGREEDFKILLKLGEALEPAEAFSFWGKQRKNLPLGP